LQFAAETPRRHAHQHTAAEGDRRADEEGVLGRVVLAQREGQRHQHEQREQHDHAADQRDDGERRGHQNRKVALTWNSFSTSRTMRFFGTKTITWSSLSITVSWCGMITFW